MFFASVLPARGVQFVHRQFQNPTTPPSLHSNGTTADLESLNAPGEGFLWHLRRILDGEIQCRRAEEAEHLAGETTIVKPLPGHPEIQGFTGGYTVKRHGLAVEVDAVQLEFGRSFRETTEVGHC